MTTPIILGATDDGDLVLDLAELLTSGLYIQGNSGSGKSGLVRKIAELTHGRVQQIILDAEGDYVTLSQDYAYVLCGSRFDVPASVENAGHLALKLYETGVSAVVDISTFKLAEQRRFIRAFVEPLMFYLTPLRVEERHHVLMVIDELQLFAPQQSDSESTEAMIDLGHRGRRLGLHPILATQRLSSVSKDAVSEIPNKLFGRTTLDVDQKRVAQELGLDTPTRRQLGRLQQRQFYAYGPALSQEPVIFTVADVQTRMPKIGELSSFTPPPPSDEVLAALAALTAAEPEIEHGATQETPVSASAGGSAYRPGFATSPATPPDDYEEHLENLTYTNRALTGDINQLEAEVQALKDQLEAERRENDRVYDTFRRNRNIARDQIIAIVDGLSFVAQEEPHAETRTRDVRRAASHEKAGTDARETDEGAEPGLASPITRSADSGATDRRNGRAQPSNGALLGGARPGVVGAGKGGAGNAGRDTEDMKDAEVEALIKRILRESGRVLVVPPAEVIRKDYLGKAIDRLMADLKELGPDALEVYRLLVSRDTYMSIAQISIVITGYQGGTTNTRWGAAAKELLDAGLVNKGGSGGNSYKASDQDARARVRKALEPHLATDQEVEDVYQAVLGRIAGEGVLA